MSGDRRWGIEYVVPRSYKVKYMLNHLFEIPIYNQVFDFIYSSYEELEDYISQKESVTFDQIGLSKDKGLIDGVTLTIGGTIYVWFSDTEATLETAIHEIGHLVYELASQIGLDINDQEAICYLQEYLFKTIMIWMNTQHIAMDHFNLQSIVGDDHQ